MAAKSSETRECPFCKESVKADAVRCKHCLATIPVAVPGHEGTCPFCREDIHPQALRCRHCKADLGPSPYGGCSGSGEGRRLRRVPRRSVTDQITPTQPLFKVGGRGNAPSGSAPRGCNDYEIDESGSIWKFIADDEDNCYYELVYYIPGRL
jgi:hypothetical protein